jgi:metal-responsive CopG/Arc/MetJ family transcriptional regulator
MSTEQQKVTVTLPRPLLERLNETVPSRRRSLFITRAIEEHLDLIEQASALEESQGAWSTEHHPDMKDDKTIEIWLKNARQSWG